MSPKNFDDPVPKNEVLFRFIKIIDIAYVAVIYFTIAFFFGSYLDAFFVYIYGTDYKKKSTFVLSLEVLSQVICIGIIVYIGRNIVEHIPFPLDGVNNFKHTRVKELTRGGFLSVFLIMFQYSMQDKLAYIRSARLDNSYINQNVSLNYGTRF